MSKFQKLTWCDPLHKTMIGQSSVTETVALHCAARHGLGVVFAHYPPRTELGDKLSSNAHSGALSDIFVANSRWAQKQ
ncbi:MAG: hypothetical protein NVS9B15_02870 [Acidobacteriaceae bacterium]